MKENSETDADIIIYYYVRLHAHVERNRLMWYDRKRKSKHNFATSFNFSARFLYELPTVFNL